MLYLFESDLAELVSFWLPNPHLWTGMEFFLPCRCLEGIRVDDDAGSGLGEFILRLQGSGVHRYQYVALVARRVDLVCTDVYLEAGDAGQ